MTAPADRPDPRALLDEALRLASQGWPVFPCVPGQKRPLTAHGLHDATTDQSTIRRWWARTPTANLAVPTGPGTIDVLDVDHRSTGSGFPALRTLADVGLLRGHQQIVATPSGGLHVYFSGTDQPSSRLPQDHLDLKAAGGYVLVPPSVVGGASYQRIGDPRPSTAVLNWPAIRELLNPTPPPPRRPVRTPVTRDAPDRGAGMAALVSWVSGLAEGRRNDGTFWAACRALEEGHKDLSPLLHAAVATGLDEREAARTLESARRRFLLAAGQSPVLRTPPASETARRHPSAGRPRARGRPNHELHPKLPQTHPTRRTP